MMNTKLNAEKLVQVVGGVDPNWFKTKAWQYQNEKAKEYLRERARQENDRQTGGCCPE